MLKPGTAVPPFWSRDAEELLASLGSSRTGLSEAEAGVRLERDGPNRLHPPRLPSGLALFLGQFFEPDRFTEVLVLLVIRTRRPFLRSKPSDPLLAGSLAVAATAIVVAVLPMPGVLGFSTISVAALGGLVGLALLLVLASEAINRLVFAAWVDSR